MMLNNKPIYISITSVYSRQKFLWATLLHIAKKQTCKPNKLFVYLSEDKSNFDEGFKGKQITFEPLNVLFKDDIFEIVWGKDIGPYGKLIPLLKEKFNEDCIIITIDDDSIYKNNLIEKLVKDYNKYNCVVGYRGFTPNYVDCHNNDLLNFNYYLRREIKNLHLHNFVTGKGGVLYHPSFFKNNDLIFKNDIYEQTCKYADDIWFNIVRITNNIPCYVESNNDKWLEKDFYPEKCLHLINNDKFNVNKEIIQEENKNNIQFKNTITLLRELKYDI